MTTAQRIRELLETYEHEHKALVTSAWFDSVIPGITGFTDHVVRQAESQLGTKIPDHILELWRWKHNRTAPILMSVFHPLPHCVHDRPLVMEDGTSVPFKGLRIGEIGPAGFAISVEPETEGEIWILGVHRSYGDGNPFDWTSGWTSLEAYINDHIHWLRNGPLLPGDGDIWLDANNQAAIENLGIHPNVRHAMGLNGQKRWY